LPEVPDHVLIDHVKGTVSMPAQKKYPTELREHAVQLYRSTRPRPVVRRLAGEAANGLEAEKPALRERPDVVLMDVLQTTRITAAKSGSPRSNTPAPKASKYAYKFR
jgi:hypothetical protein